MADLIIRLSILPMFVQTAMELVMTLRMAQEEPLNMVLQGQGFKILTSVTLTSRFRHIKMIFAQPTLVLQYTLHRLPSKGSRG